MSNTVRHIHKDNPPVHIPMDVDVWTIKEVAAYLRISVWEVRKLAKQGQIPGRRVGDWRFHRLTIMALMEGGTHGAEK
jgi:excisionase family DNA binding protein